VTFRDLAMFRDGLLDGRRVAIAGGGGVAILEQLAALGATVDALVVCAGASFGSGGEAGLGTALELAWRSARAVATGALIEAERPGKLVFVAPRPEAGPYAEPARAALENLARTLSVEWARFTVTAVAIAPGATTTDDQLAELVCFLVSGAGDYFSGCRFDLGAIPVALGR